MIKIINLEVGMISSKSNVSNNCRANTLKYLIKIHQIYAVEYALKKNYTPLLIITLHYLIFYVHIICLYICI